MRLFANQTNDVWTTPMLNQWDKTPIENAVVTVQIYEANGSTTIGSLVTLPHTAGGVYKSTIPNIISVARNCVIEFTAKVSGVNVYYMKGDIAAIIRGTVNP